MALAVVDKKSKHLHVADMSITFSKEDLEDVKLPHADPLVVELLIEQLILQRILVDNGSSVDIMYKFTYDKMKMEKPTLSEPTQCQTHLYSFSKYVIPVSGIVELEIIFGMLPSMEKLKVEFYIVDTLSAYQSILGRTTINELQAVISIFHLCMKFPTSEGVGMIRGLQKNRQRLLLQHLVGTPIGREEVCILESTKLKKKLRDAARENGEPEDGLEDLQFGRNHPGKTIKIGTNLPTEIKDRLADILRNKIDIFAWSPSDMPGIKRSIIEYDLKIFLHYRPVVQRKRTFAKNVSKPFNRRSKSSWWQVSSGR